MAPPNYIPNIIANQAEKVVHEFPSEFFNVNGTLFQNIVENNLT